MLDRLFTLGLWAAVALAFTLVFATLEASAEEPKAKTEARVEAMKKHLSTRLRARQLKHRELHRLEASPHYETLKHRAPCPTPERYTRRAKCN